MAPRAAPPEVSVIVPTFNEFGNVLELKVRLEETLRNWAWEVVFVDDDSTDGTLDVLRQMARSDPRVRMIHRIGRRGLATAVVEGVQSTSAPLVAVMDADLQHDEAALPRMIANLEVANADLVVGSRYMEGGGIGEWSRRRHAISRLATRLSQIVVRAELSDPMSGFFLIRREAFDRSVRRLSNQGYKSLLDIVASAEPRLNVAETPYQFRPRVHGDSKLDSAVTWEYVMLLVDKLIGHVIPLRFFMFALVGGVGVIVHMTVLTTSYQGAGMNFAVAQTLAAMVAMTFNFFVNNALTYRDKRLKGLWATLRGLLSFYLVCAVGTVANVGIAGFLFDNAYSWWLAGVAGILVGAVWNYAASSIFTWRK